ncbi:MAG: hypothetical protein ABSE20_09705 [Acetobacteraceae bacterium]|jgi:hypothetical protein
MWIRVECKGNLINQIQQFALELIVGMQTSRNCQRLNRIYDDAEANRISGDILTAGHGIAHKDAIKL